MSRRIVSYSDISEEVPSQNQPQQPPPGATSITTTTANADARARAAQDQDRNSPVGVDVGVGSAGSKGKRKWNESAGDHPSTKTTGSSSHNKYTKNKQNKSSKKAICNVRSGGNMIHWDDPMYSPPSSSYSALNDPGIDHLLVDQQGPTSKLTRDVADETVPTNRRSSPEDEQAEEEDQEFYDAHDPESNLTSDQPQGGVKSNTSTNSLASNTLTWKYDEYAEPYDRSHRHSSFHHPAASHPPRKRPPMHHGEVEEGGGAFDGDHYGEKELGRDDGSILYGDETFDDEEYEGKYGCDEEDGYIEGEWYGEEDEEDEEGEDEVLPFAIPDVAEFHRTYSANHNNHTNTSQAHLGTSAVSADVSSSTTTATTTTAVSAGSTPHRPPVEVGGGGRLLTHAEIWGDLSLVHAYQSALDQYCVFHSLPLPNPHPHSNANAGGGGGGRNKDAKQSSYSALWNDAPRYDSLLAKQVKEDTQQILALKKNASATTTSAAAAAEHGSERQPQPSAQQQAKGGGVQSKGKEKHKVGDTQTQTQGGGRGGVGGQRGKPIVTVVPHSHVPGNTAWKKAIKTVQSTRNSIGIPPPPPLPPPPGATASSPPNSVHISKKANVTANNGHQSEHRAQDKDKLESATPQHNGHTEAHADAHGGNGNDGEEKRRYYEWWYAGYYAGLAAASTSTSSPTSASAPAPLPASDSAAGAVPSPAPAECKALQQHSR